MDATAALNLATAMHGDLAARRPGIDKAERYYRGDQPLAYASTEWSELHRERYREFSDNWCGVVGSAPAERLTLQGFRLESDSNGRTPEERELWRAWDMNDMTAQSSQGFLQSGIAKRSFVLVWGDDDDQPIASWEHPSQVLVRYNPETRRRTAAIKSWTDDDTEFLTLYTRDEVFKWERGVASKSGLIVTGASFGSDGWTPRQGTGDDTWPIRNPLGEVPVVEFANRPMLGGEPLSEIDGTMAMQDAVNLLWAYLFVAADYASMPARVVLGQQPPKVPILDDNGVKVGEREVDSAELKKGRMLWLTGQDTKVGQWDAAKLDVFTDVINIAVRHVAAQTRTPIYLVHGELGNVNGETLTGLDAPLVSKVREAQTFYQRPMREVFALMAKASGDDKVAAQARVGVVDWADPAVYSVSQLADAAIKDRQLGLPLASVLERRYGYTDTEIERVMSQIRDEQADPFLERLVAKDAAAQG